MVDLPCMKLKMLPPTSTPLEIRCTECIYIYIYTVSVSLRKKNEIEEEEEEQLEASRRHHAPFHRLFFVSSNKLLSSSFLSSTAYVPPLPSYSLPPSAFRQAGLTYQHCICCTVLCKCNQIICHLPGQIL